MQPNASAIELLNDLILINNDRITGYEKAAHQSVDIEPDIKSVFHHMASESRRYVSDLGTEIIKLGGQPITGTSLSGKLYRFWMSLKATFSGHDSHALLAACEEGEDAAQKAYRHSMENPSLLPGTIYELLQKQQKALKSSHDLIRRYRNTRSFSRP